MSWRRELAEKFPDLYLHSVDGDTLRLRAVTLTRSSAAAVPAEVRDLATAAELRELGDSVRIVGLAAPYNQLSEWIYGEGSFRERFAPGAFRRALAEGQDVRALWNHDSSVVLGRSGSGTLTVFEDQAGLRYEIEPPSWAAPQLETIRRGDVSQSSFAFIARGESWDMEGGIVIRTVTDADLYDVSPVAFPAYPGSQANLRGLTSGSYLTSPAIGEKVQGEQSTKADRSGGHSADQRSAMETERDNLAGRIALTTMR